MSDEPKTADDLLNKTKRLVSQVGEYTRSDEAKAKLAEAKKRAVEVGGAAFAGARDVLDKTGRAATRAKVKIEELSNSERVGHIRLGSKGLWDRSKAIKVRGVPWMESPIAIGILLVLLFPLGLWLVWRHPAWSKGRKVAWAGVWAGLMVLGIVALRQDERTAATAYADAGLAPSKSDKTSEKLDGSHSNRADPATKIGDLSTADASELTPGNALAVLETMASKIEPFDVLGIDYSKGPRGEAIISRPGLDPQTGKTTTDSGFVGTDGQFRLHGLRTSWYGPPTAGSQRRKFQEISYFDGQPHGIVRNWYETGEKQSEMTMRRGERHGLAVSYFKDGKVVHASLWNGGRADGPQCDWYRSGGIKGLKHYKLNAAHGVKKSWYEDGMPESECRYVEGQLHGELVEWSPTGKIVKTLWKEGSVHFAPGQANKRSFYFKLIELADLHDPDSTNFEFKSPVEVLNAFGRPLHGSLNFSPDRGDPASPREWRYRCTDGTLAVRVVYIIPQGSFHVLIDPSATMD